MLRRVELRWALGVCAGVLLLAGCASVSAPPTVLSTQTASAVAATATLAAATLAPATATPTGTASAAPSPVSTGTSTPTVAPTGTDTAAPTATATPSSPPSPTASPAHLATRPPATIAPLGPPETAPLLSTTGGPAGYASTIQCQRAGAACTPVMPPGDISFRLSLAGGTSAPWTHFIYYGLSVERDGANVAGQFMFVDAGWLQPGTVVGFGASRNFSQPGLYVIRSSGCLTTDAKSSGCVWSTIAGDVVTFRIE